MASDDKIKKKCSPASGDGPIARILGVVVLESDELDFKAALLLIDISDAGSARVDFFMRDDEPLLIVRDVLVGALPGLGAFGEVEGIEASEGAVDMGVRLREGDTVMLVLVLVVARVVVAVAVVVVSIVLRHGGN